ncbi:Peroxisome biosynthesis protein pex1 [Coemansia sp. RSA 1939]|nr:Peroxisome biosynthesis protein pex1 [Coemansia sp. RSA 1939]KAJ2615074.1 Peroxisome biosynthesis protein pex1 [Coemansia sp. RSA 1804]KAJ2686598.1 Peroxisome biosynthesis protein pex1 [Coemansia sp. RSA 1285]
MPQQLEVAFRPLRTCHVNLPPRWVAALSGQPASKGGSIVLKLGWGAQNTAYVTWAGGASRGDSKEKLEIDSVYGKQLGIPAESIAANSVSVEYVAGVGICTAASVEPAGFDDWEVLEANAGAVEARLLRQARVVVSGQPIVFWLDASASVCLIPSQITPDPSSTGGSHRCALLDNDTEIIVAPKVRAHSADGARRQQLVVPDDQSSRDRHPRLIIHCLRAAELAPADGAADFGTLYVAAGSALAKEADKGTGVVRIGKIAADASSTNDNQSAGPWICRLGVSTTIQPGVLCAAQATLRAAGIASGQLVRAQAVSVPVEKPKVLTFAMFAGQGNEAREKDDDVAVVRRALAQMLNMQPVVVLNVGASIPTSAAPDARLLARVVSYTASDRNSDFPAVSPEEVPLRIDGRLLPLLQIECEETNAAGMDVGSAQGELAGVDGFLASAWTSILGSLTTAGSGGVLVCGRRGSGKTSIARYLEKRVSAYRGQLVYSRHVDCTSLAMDARGDKVRESVRMIVADALMHQLTLLVLDDLDALAPAEKEQGDSRRLRRIVDALVTALDPGDGRRVVVLATASSRSSVHPRLFDASVLGDVLEIPAPGRTERELVLAAIARESATPLDAEDANLAAVSYMTEGYMPADLSALYERAAHEATMRALSADADGSETRVSVRHADIERAISGFRPRSLRGVQLQASQTRWADIGGLQDTRRLLRETLELPSRYAAVFATSPLRLRSGILLYGYPGCGKTLLASAVARECGLNFIGCKGPELLSKYIGSSEQAVRDLFARAVAAAPCVLFFDEFESLAPRRGHDNTGVTDRVVNQFLTEMDGAEGLTGVYVLAATSRPDLIDPALLRPGRLDKALLCAMPDAEDRADILRRLARRLRVAPDVDWRALADAADGFSGADLQALVYNAFLESVHAMPSPADATTGAGNAEDPRLPDFEILSSLHGTNSQSPAGAEERARIADRLLRLVRMSSDDGSVPAGTSVSAAAAAPEPPTVAMRFFTDALAYTHPSMAAADRLRLDSIYRSFVDGKKGSSSTQKQPIEQRATLA